MDAQTSAIWALWAKKGKPGEMTWLPLPQHLLDAARVARLLWRRWLPESVRHLIESDLDNPELGEELLVFLAAAHDVGKGLPLFQSKPKTFQPDDLDSRIVDGLRASGLPAEPFSFFINIAQTPHALATQALLEHWGCDDRIALILGAHHGKPSPQASEGAALIAQYPNHYHLGATGRDAWQAAQAELLDLALQQGDFESLDQLPVPGFLAQVLLTGLVIMADWIASNERLFPYWTYGEPSAPVLDGSRADTAWKKLDLPPPWHTDESVPALDYYQARFKISKPYPAQAEALRIAKQIAAPGIMILEAPMGSGKTEAALVIAENFATKAQKAGVLFALPTQATSNAIFPRLLDWTRQLEIDKAYSVRLAHAKAQFNEGYRQLMEGSSHVGETAEDAVVHQWFEGNKKSLLADFVVGTIDQFLLAALRQKHVMLRHLGLAGKVVILDETHAFSSYMNYYLDRALEWMGAYRVPVIILSATLPAQRRTQLIHAYLGKTQKPAAVGWRQKKQAPPPPPPAPWTISRGYPLITWTEGETVRQQELPHTGVSHQVLLERITREDVPARLKVLLKNGGYAGIMVNTVDRAQQIAAQMKAAFPLDEVTLVHAQFITPDRAELEKKLLSVLGKPRDGQARSGRHIVVGTQVIEQSLDLDFDVLITDLCPMDLLLQRMGRLHRHDRARPEGLTTARCLIMEATGERFEPGAKAIYKTYPLMRTLAFLPEDALRLPDDIPRLVQDVYDDQLPLDPQPEGYETAKREWQDLTAKQEGRAGTYRMRGPGALDSMAGWLEMVPSEAAGEASVRDGGDSVEVLVVYHQADGRYAPLPWTEEGPASQGIYAHETPSSEAARQLAKQSLRLPRRLCHEGIIDKTIAELEVTNKVLSAWQQSPWLKGQLFLVLDAEYEAMLCGYNLCYQKELGLQIQKEGGAHD